MATTENITSNTAAPSADALFDGREYFTYSAIFAAMAKSVQKHDPQLFIRCAGAIDMGHTCTLRGLGYLGQLLAGDKNADDMQRGLAGGTIAEMTALVAVLVEMQNDASVMELGQLSH